MPNLNRRNEQHALEALERSAHTTADSIEVRFPGLIVNFTGEEKLAFLKLVRAQWEKQ